MNAHAPVAYRRKLIEVDLPLDKINEESRRERAIRHGHPSTLHQWWARLSLGACRAVIFASMIDDPSSCPDEFPTQEQQAAERERLHNLMKELVKWESTDESTPTARQLIAEAQYEIARSIARGHDKGLPDKDKPFDVLRYLNDAALPVYDPFAGGGTIPLESHRLGLKAIASDLNPVAVTINKALIELPPKFHGQPPVNPDADPMKRGGWKGAAGLADDIRWYGRWMRERAFERIGHLYPRATLPDGTEATVIAWLWTRTVPCPNPACEVAMPLIKTLQLSQKKGNEHWACPSHDAGMKAITFTVQDHAGGVPKGGTVDRNGAICLACGTTAKLSYIREQGRDGRIGEQMLGIVAEGDRERLFLSAIDEHVRTALASEPEWRPLGNLPDQALGFRVQRYGFTKWSDLFTPRQLAALTTFSELIAAVRVNMDQNGATSDYIASITTYLALAIGRAANSGSSFATWQNAGDKVSSVFKIQGIPIVWDFAEVNPFSGSTNNWMAQIEWISRIVERLPTAVNSGTVHQANASMTIHAQSRPVIITDPPYYDNVAYADLSDFFYTWMRPLLRDTYPELFAGITTPKEDEMIAEPYRFENPRERFESLLLDTLQLIRDQASPEFPTSIFYAYKQQEEQREGRISTGWETMLTALVDAGFQISSTWPMRTTGGRVRAAGSNALATSVVLVCRPRPEDAPLATRGEFLEALRTELPGALEQLTRGHIAPVDLAQAAIGPGMQVYSRYRRVETIGGEPVTVREALAEINREVARHHEREEGALDGASRFCAGWLRQHGYDAGAYGEAETLARAMNVTVEGLSPRLLEAVGGKVRLLRPEAYAHDGQAPLAGLTAWEGAFRMAWHLWHERGAGTAGAAAVARGMGSGAAAAERLARILYEHFDRKGDSANAVRCNGLVTAWPEIEQARLGPEQAGMELGG